MSNIFQKMTYLSVLQTLPQKKGRHLSCCLISIYDYSIRTTYIGIGIASIRIKYELDVLVELLSAGSESGEVNRIRSGRK